ncbi:hypothetical protein SB6411_00918 [Klebsiella spallanzanii]|uniref:Uncharacterized protein n=1 Tax=Klebsiella spallanzanii TaxID=2587528 RepID=A0ABY6VDE4_9ENTR|nr:hypothetical protein SB6411_00918 [Klebsiella spallanzanii]
MAPLLIAAITPDDPGFTALRVESLAQNYNMLRRLQRTGKVGKTALTPREKSCWVPLRMGSWSACAG